VTFGIKDSEGVEESTVLDPFEQSSTGGGGGGLDLETPGVNPALMSQVMPSNNVMETGLTPTEQALLSDEEKGIRLRQRGMTT